jgi:UDP-N-acetylmuramoylalanine--D-glutamate ligase
MFTNKKIFILGMARSGYEAAKFLAGMNNNIVINDMSDKQDENHIKELEKLGVKVVLGSHPDEIFTKDFDYLIKNPGIRNDHKYVLKAKEYGIPVINEVEMAYSFFPKDITIIGITGTNGKTTTTTIIYELLKKAGKRVHLTGNIGFPVASFIRNIKPGDIIVMEISCQQFVNMKEFKTNIAVLTNLYEAHLDFFNGYDDYKSYKKKIFNQHTKDDYAILNMDNNDVLDLTKDIDSTKLYFSSKKENKEGCYIKDNAIYYLDEKVINLNDIKIKGMHNYENIMASILAVKQLGISNEDIVKTLEEFGGVEHRIEFVKTLNNRTFYNDSKSTNVKATQTALLSMDKPTILLLGGLDRGHSFEGLKEYLSNVKIVVSYGETKERIKTFIESLNISCYVVSNLEEATKKAYELSEEGDVILLSPACASWDQFKDFEERGREFKKYVQELK